MGNCQTIVDDHRALLVMFGVPKSVVERINYNSIVQDNKKSIQQETKLALKKRMPMGDGEHNIIVMDLVFLPKYTRPFLLAFNEVMKCTGFRIYDMVPLRARYHMEALKKKRFDFRTILAKYLLPVPVFAIANQPDPTTNTNQLETDEESVASLDTSDSDSSQETRIVGTPELRDQFEMLHIRWFPSMVRLGGWGYFDSMCIANTLADDERALAIAGDLPLNEMESMW